MNEERWRWADGTTGIDESFELGRQMMWHIGRHLPSSLQPPNLSLLMMALGLGWGAHFSPLSFLYSLSQHSPSFFALFSSLSLPNVGCQQITSIYFNSWICFSGSVNTLQRIADRNCRAADNGLRPADIKKTRDQQQIQTSRYKTLSSRYKLDSR